MAAKFRPILAASVLAALTSAIGVAHVADTSQSNTGQTGATSLSVGRLRLHSSG
jgi:hypothetical protein